jgi:hypothetical protein
VPAILEQGISSSLSLPLLALDEAVGALNLYSRDHAGFASSEAVGEVFAARAAVTMANAAAYYRATELVGHLSLALDHRDVIAQAKGILMAKEGVSSDEAFDILRRASQRANRKLYDIATEIIGRHTPGAPSAEER